MRKTVRTIMKVTTIILGVITCFSTMLIAKTTDAQNLKDVKLNIAFEHQNLASALAELETITHISFTYDKNVLNSIKAAELHYTHQSLAVILQYLLKGSGFGYEVINNNIVIGRVHKKPVPPEPGKIYGKILDDKGEAMPGASIRIKELNRTVSSAVDGSYSISVASGTYTVEVSYVSYQTKQISGVGVKSEGLTKLDVVLISSSNALKGVVIQSSFKKEAIAGLYAQQKNAAGITDGISAEQIARTPDNNMGQVLKRISGVTTVDNRFIVVRGLTERYNQGMIDGVILPSTDMNRRNFSFDVIPAEMVSNVVVNKTATPDVSSEFAGGQVSINTLDIPLENFTVLSAGSGFNSQTLGKDYFQAGKRGKYDLFGFDDGGRKLPQGIQSWTANGNEAPPDFAGTQSKLFSPDVFKIFKYSGGVNQNYRFSTGQVYNLKNSQKWGFVAGVSLRNNQETNDYQSVRGMTTGTLDNPLALIDTAYGRRNGHIYRYNSTLGGQFNIGIQGQSYKIGLKNFFSQILTNNFSTDEGSRQILNTLNEERDQTNYQEPKITRVLQHKLEGENSLTNSGLKLTWSASKTTVRQEYKDVTKFNYRRTGEKDGVEYFQDPNVITPRSNEADFDFRLFTDTRETDYNWAANLSQSFNFLGDKSIFKGGYNGIFKKRTLDATLLYIYSEDGAFDYYNQPYDLVMSPERIGTGTQQAYYLPARTNGRQFDGKSNFNAGYLMLDQHFLNKIRLVYGMRVEGYKMENKHAEIYTGGTPKATGEDNTTYLPSANLTYSITPKINFRASFAKTIIRPDFRELSYFGFYDPDLKANIVGADVLSTKIKNTDLRLEWYPSAGEIISVSAFHKSLDKPIELVVDQDATGRVTQYRLQNQKEAVNYGGEIEVRKSLGFIADKQWLRNFSLFGNGSLIKSEVTTLTQNAIDGSTTENKVKRALYGQAPYVINAGMSYASDRYGLTLNYNRSGHRTYTISSNPMITEFENGRDQVDLQLFARLMNRRMEIKLNVGNLLNSTTLFYVNANGYTRDANGSSETFEYLPNKGKDSYEKEFDDVRYRIKYGVTSSFLVTYKF